LSQTESRGQLSSKDRRAFVWRKLHSLTGVVPVGVFLLLHLWTNAKALQGRRAFDEAVGELARLPYLVVVEVMVIAVPLLLHAAIGLKITLSARPNVGRYPTTRNWMYLLQRLSGVVTLAFVAYHLYALRIQVAMGRMDKADFFDELCSSMSATLGPGIPVVALVYLLGVAAAVLHFSNGLYGFCFAWGITRSRRATRLASGAFGLLGLVLFVLGANTVIYFATGTRLTWPTRASASEPPALSCRDVTAAGHHPEGRGKERALSIAQPGDQP
jgi:succinate dehydrogenase / fumarate reductase cytochrome b subunit